MDDDPYDDPIDEQDEFSEEEGFGPLEMSEGDGEDDLGGELGDDLVEELAGAAGDGDGGDELAWRETYFILFSKSARPTLTQVEAAIGEAGARLTMEHLEADDDGLFQSILVQSPEDNAALEISYEASDAVIQQSAELAKDLQSQVDGEQLAQLLRADARLDIMHFERVEDGLSSIEVSDEIAMEALNPATLISVVEALASLTGGLPIDPAAGELLI